MVMVVELIHASGGGEQRESIREDSAEGVSDSRLWEK